MRKRLHPKPAFPAAALLALSIFLTLALPVAALARGRAGGQDAGGGDPQKAEQALLSRRYEKEFREVAEGLLREIDTAGLRSEELGYSLESLRESVRSSMPYATDNPQAALRIGSKAVGAVNSAYHRTIAFSSLQWGLLSRPDQKRSFALHEYLRMTTDRDGKPADDSGYGLSSRTLALLAAPGELRQLCWMNYNDLWTKLRGSADVYFTLAAGEDEARKEVRRQCIAENGQDKGYCEDGYSPIYCLPVRDTGYVVECSVRPTLGGRLLRGLGFSDSSEAMLRLRKACYQEKGPTSCNINQRGMRCRVLTKDEAALAREERGAADTR